MERLFGMLAQSAIAGRAADWARPSAVQAFTQPWYAPLPVTPETTGIALGGIGSSYLLNPRARTVALQFLSGLPVLSEPDGPELHDFFFSERDTLDDAWQQVKLPQFLATNAFYPLRRANGAPWFTGRENAEQIADILRQLAGDAELVPSNAGALERWSTSLSLPQLLQGSPRHRNRTVLAALYGECASIGTPRLKSLVASDGRRFGVPCYDANAVVYRALFPAVGFSYAEPDACHVERVSFSPIVPQGKDVALPVTLTRLAISNPSSRSKTITLTWLGENLNGYRHVKSRPGCQDAAHRLARTPAHQSNRALAVEGVDACALLSADRRSDGVFGTTAMAIAIDAGSLGRNAVQLSRRTELYQSECESTLRTAAAVGTLADRESRGVRSSSDGLYSALTVTAELPSQGSVNVDCYLALDFPELTLGDAKRRKHYGMADAATAPVQDHAARVVSYAARQQGRFAEQVVEHHARLERAVEQKLSQHSPELRRRVVTTMATTLSTLCESAVWSEDGEFLARECLDYPYYNSLDVYFYGSFGLAYLLPEVDERCVQAFFDATAVELPEPRGHWHYASHPHADGAEQYLGARKAAMRVPHDLGSPLDLLPNAYAHHDTAGWHDLAPKLALLAYRSYRLTGNPRALSRARQPLEQLMSAAAARFELGQALPWSQGTSNTYDNLSVCGMQIYNAQLWLAALEAYVATLRALGEHAGSERWSTLLARGRVELFDRLWDAETGRFNYNTGPILSLHLRSGAERELQARLSQVDVPFANGPAAALNELIYARRDEPARWRQLEALCGRSLADLRAEPKARRISGAKLALFDAVPGCWVEGFRDYANVESDALFADQLIGDFYLRKLGLPPICDDGQTRSVLRNLYQLAFLRNSPIVGIPNLVRADGGVMSEFQAQDIWLGVTFTVAEAMREQGLHREYAHVMGQALDLLYEFSRIPFGVPEGFNCTYATDASATAEQRDLVSALLARSASRVSDEDAGYLNGGERAALQCPLFTAGRYMRPGSIFSLLWGDGPAS